MQDFLHFCHGFVFFSAGLHSHGIHTLQCPGQVDCGGSGRIQIFLIFGKFLIKLFKIFGLDAVCQQINTQCRRYADGRSPSDFQQINGIPKFPVPYVKRSVRSCRVIRSGHDYDRILCFIQCHGVVIENCFFFSIDTPLYMFS